jgi:exonuclease SbcC
VKEAAVRLQASEAAVTATQGQLAEWLGEGDARTLLEAREGEVAAAREALEGAKAAIDPARSAFDLAREAAEGAAAVLAELAGRLAGAWGRLGQDRAVAPEVSAVASAYVELGETIVEGLARAQAELEAALGRAAELDAALAALLGSLGLTPGQEFRAALTEAEVLQRTQATRVADLKDRISRAGSLSSEVRRAQTRRSLAQRLSEDLRPSRFLAFLLEEERAELAELGSDHLELLTGGDYRFAEDDSFDIADLNAAGSIRKAASLSGGETFLASLALALALAQMVARGAGRLEAFFLDEGFGSLDPEHLDRAMEGIGRLVAGDERRLVVLVSHVAEMREAIEDLVVLEKHGVTGDSIVRSGARPAV